MRRTREAKRGRNSFVMDRRPAAYQRLTQALAAVA
jgi:hypothetical protein